MWVDIQDEEEA